MKLSTIDDVVARRTRRPGAGITAGGTGGTTAWRAFMTASIGPVKADPYLWPYDGTVPVDRVALVCIDWQTDFCGPGGYVDAMGYDIALTRAGLPATARLLTHARELGMPGDPHA
jgi:hypothetical protein